MNVEPLPPTVWGLLSGLNEKVTDDFATLEAVGDSVLSLETSVFEVKEKSDNQEASTGHLDTSTESDNVFFEAVCRNPGQKDMLPSKAELLHTLDKRMLILEKRYDKC